MMTRKAVARQVESQLQMALQELKASKELVNQLNREREDNERELLDVLDRNSILKKELSDLHTKLLIAYDERDRLQSTIDGFDQCSSEYEQALRRIAALDKQLHEANNRISQLESNTTQSIASQNQSLFEELVCSAPSLVSASCHINPIATIDLTNEDSISTNVANSVGVSSRNKLKKYIRINRYIKKTKKLINHNKKFVKYTHCVRERMQLIDKLQTCSEIIHENRQIYEKNLNSLNSKMISLQESLQTMTQNYDRSKKEIREYILALKCMSNVSAVSETPTKRHSFASGLGASEPLTQQPVCEPLVSNTCYNINTYENNSLTQNSCNKYVMFSDEIGKNLGQLLNLHMELSCVNHCFPGLSLQHIFEKILTSKLDRDTNLIIFVGNRGKLNRKMLLYYYNQLCMLKLKSIVMFTLPYCKCLPQDENENNIRYN